MLTGRAPAAWARLPRTKRMNDDAEKTERQGDITPSGTYNVLSNLVVHAEQVRWTRLNNFLIANTIFVLAWAGVFSSSAIAFPVKQIALTWICVPGLVSGFLWGVLGWRSSKYHDLFNKLVVSLEKSHAGGLPNPFTRAEPIRAQARRQRVTSSRFLVTWIPVGFSLLYAGLITLSWLAR